MAARMRVCRTCKRPKPRAEFRRAGRGIHPDCKGCQAAAGYGGKFIAPRAAVLRPEEV